MKESQLVAKAELKDSKITTRVSWPQKGVFANQSRLNVSMDRTGVLDLREGLMYLIRYPYGCLEQTLSKTIPLTKARELLSALKLKGNLRKQMKKFLKIGLAKIVRHQHANGHFSLWPGGTPQAQLTAYALYGLNEAKKAGLKVDERAIKKGLKALHKWSQQKTKLLFGGKSGTLAMAAFVLAELGKPNASLNARLYEARQLLPTYGKGFLLRAMKRSGTSETQLKAFLKEITSAIEMKGAIAMAKPCHAMFSKALCRPLAWYMSSTVRTTAILLSAILEVSPKHPLIPMLVRGLKSRQNRWGRWSNTQENIYSLVAIADHARTLAKGSSTVQIRLKNSTTMKFISGRSVVRHNPTLKSVPQGPMTIESKGRAHVRAVLNLVGRWKAPNFKFNGFSITRLYLDPKTNKVIDSFKVGQVVKVRVIVKTPKRRYYVAMTDRLPAGFEAINEGLATTSRANRRNRRSYIWNYVALKDDRIYAFANNMYSGTHTFEYRVRATLSGTFSIQPAKVEAMYSPHIFGRTNERKMSIQP